MGDRYFSRTYRGFLLQQTDRGWIVPQLPNWSNGPVPQGPFSTYGIAEHVIDRVLDNDIRQQEMKNPPRKREVVQEPVYNYSSSESSSSFFGSLISGIGWIAAGIFLYDVFTK